MHLLTYANRDILTSSAAAEATFSYCAALVQSQLADVVRVPSVNDYGWPIAVALLLTPSTQLLSTPAEDDVLETDDTAFVEDIQMRTNAILQGIFT